METLEDSGGTFPLYFSMRRTASLNIKRILNWLILYAYVSSTKFVVFPGSVWEVLKLIMGNHELTVFKVTTNRLKYSSIATSEDFSSLSLISFSLKKNRM